MGHLLSLGHASKGRGCREREEPGFALALRQIPPAHWQGNAPVRIALQQNRLPNVAAQIRVAFPSMAWNTGSSSPGELEITRSTPRLRSAVSSDSLRSSVRCAGSLSRPRVLDGNDGLGSEVAQ